MRFGRIGARAAKECFARREAELSHCEYVGEPSTQNSLCIREDGVNGVCTRAVSGVAFEGHTRGTRDTARASSDQKQLTSGREAGPAHERQLHHRITRLVGLCRRRIGFTALVRMAAVVCMTL